MLAPDRLRKGPLMDESDKPYVAVFSLGGTIAMTRAPNGGVSPALSASDLLAAYRASATPELNWASQTCAASPGRLSPSLTCSSWRRDQRRADRWL